MVETDLNSCLEAPSGPNQFDQLLLQTCTKANRRRRSSGSRSHGKSSKTRESRSHGILSSQQQPQQQQQLSFNQKRSLKRSRREFKNKTSSVRTTRPTAVSAAKGQCLSIEISYNANFIHKTSSPSSCEISCTVTSDKQNLLGDTVSSSSRSSSLSSLPTFVSKRLVSLNPVVNINGTVNDTLTGSHASATSWSMDGDGIGIGGGTGRQEEISKSLHQHILSCIQRSHDVITLQTSTQTKCKSVNQMNLDHILILLLSLRAGLWVKPKRSSSDSGGGGSNSGGDDYMLIPISPFEGKLIRLHKRRKSFDVRVIPPSTIKKPRPLSNSSSFVSSPSIGVVPTSTSESITHQVPSKHETSPPDAFQTPRIQSKIKQEDTDSHTQAILEDTRTSTSTSANANANTDGCASEPLSWHEFQNAHRNCLVENNPTSLQFARDFLPRAWQALESLSTTRTTRDGKEHTNTLPRLINIRSKLQLLRETHPLGHADLHTDTDTTITSPSSLLMTRQELWDLVRARPSSNQEHDKSLVRLVQLEISIRMQLYVGHEGEDDFLNAYGKFIVQHSPTQEKKKKKKRRKVDNETSSRTYSLQDYISEICSLIEIISSSFSSTVKFSEIVHETIIDPYRFMAPDVVAGVLNFFEIDSSDLDSTSEEDVKDLDVKREPNQESHTGTHIGKNTHRASQSKWNLRTQNNPTTPKVKIEETKMSCKITPSDEMNLFKKSVDIKVQTRRDNPLLANTRGKYVGSHFSNKLSNMANLFHQVETSSILNAEKENKRNEHSVKSKCITTQHSGIKQSSSNQRFSVGQRNISALRQIIDPVDIQKSKVSETPISKKTRPRLGILSGPRKELFAEEKHRRAQPQAAMLAARANLAIRRKSSNARSNLKKIRNR